jgi:predicted MFS family arabinose efflux permease
MLIALAHSDGRVALAGAALTGAGQALLVPSLGLLALESVRDTQHGFASGAFYAFTDAGIAAGGIVAGLTASTAGPRAAVAIGALSVSTVPLVAITRRRTASKAAERPSG